MHLFHSQYEFGDIISFKPRCGPRDTSYMHFAVYVGDREFDDKKEGDNTFERLSMCAYKLKNAVTLFPI